MKNLQVKAMAGLFAVWISTSALTATADSRLLGAWESDAENVGPDDAIATWTFNEDKTYRVDLFYPAMNLKAPPQTGGYKVAEGRIEMIDPVKKTVIQVSGYRFEGKETLVIIDPDGKEFTYLRKK